MLQLRTFSRRDEGEWKVVSIRECLEAVLTNLGQRLEDLQDDPRTGTEEGATVMRILLAVDESEHSNAATKSISSRPWPIGSAVLVLFVAEMYTPLPIPYGMINYEEVTQSLLKRAQDVLERTTAKLGILGVAIESRVRQGDPRQEILDEANDWGADLIVVGSHGRTGLQRWLLGSVAEHVVRHARCSVEVVRLPQR